MKNKRYYAIDLLRVLLAFGVVLCHFWSPESETGLNSIILAWRRNAAPAFFLLSFFLIGMRFLANDQAYLKKRLRRLFIPFLSWGIISWVIYGAAHFSQTSKRILLTELFWQLLTGHGESINPPLWFLAVLCWLTALYGLIFKKLNRKNAVVTISVLAVLSLFLQGTGINYRLFEQLPFGIKYPFGRAIEMIPYATAGILLASVSERYKVTLPLFITAATGLFCYLLFPEFLEFQGYGYSGIMKLIASASLIIIALYIDSFSVPDSLQPVIRTVSAHTLGIYCMHYDVGFVISKLHFFHNTFLLCIVIYIVCYFIAAGIARIPRLQCLVD